MNVRLSIVAIRRPIGKPGSTRAGILDRPSEQRHEDPGRQECFLKVRLVGDAGRLACCRGWIATELLGNFPVALQGQGA